MKTTQKGFIALFFTLGMASMLLAAISVNSESIFEFVRSRERFREIRTAAERPLQCADGFMDILSKTIHWFSESEYEYVFQGISCRVSDIDIVRESRSSMAFTFMSGNIPIHGKVIHGFISL